MVSSVAFNMAVPKYARVIALLLRDYGKKQADLARGTGIAEATISAIVNGRQRLHAEHRAKIAAFFRYTPEQFDQILSGEAREDDSPAAFESRLEDLPIDQRRAHWFLQQIMQTLGTEQTSTILRAAAQTFNVELTPLPSDPPGTTEFVDYLKRFATNSPRIIKGPTFKGAHGGLEHHEEHPDLTPDIPPTPITPIHVPRKKAK